MLEKAISNHAANTRFLQGQKTRFLTGRFFNQPRQPPHLVRKMIFSNTMRGLLKKFSYSAACCVISLLQQYNTTDNCTATNLCVSVVLGCCDSLLLLLLLFHWSCEDETVLLCRVLQQYSSTAVPSVCTTNLKTTPIPDIERLGSFTEN